MESIFPARAEISRSALTHNFQNIKERLEGQQVMAIVKADAYGHGLAEAARVFIAAGADYLGVAQLEEALHLARELEADPGAATPIFSWIYAPGDDLREAISRGIELSVGTAWALEAVSDAAQELRARGVGPARVHIAIDSGMTREGFGLKELSEHRERIAELVARGLIEVVGLWSHLACADAVDSEGKVDSDPTAAQLSRFNQAREMLASVGCQPAAVHLAASGGTLWQPAARFSMVRPGIVLRNFSQSANCYRQRARLARGNDVESANRRGSNHGRRSGGLLRPHAAGGKRNAFGDRPARLRRWNSARGVQ